MNEIFQDIFDRFLPRKPATCLNCDKPLVNGGVWSDDEPFCSLTCVAEYEIDSEGLWAEEEDEDDKL